MNDLTAEIKNSSFGLGIGPLIREGVGTNDKKEREKNNGGMECKSYGRVLSM